MHDEVCRLASRQHGLVTRTQLRQVGVDRGTIYRWANGNSWEALTPEVLRRSGSGETVEQALLAIVLDAGPTARLSHLSAANRWGLTGCRLLPAHLVCVSTAHDRRGDAIRHRVRVLPPHWATELDCIPIARPELVAMQLFAVCSSRRAARLTDRLWSERLLSGPSIQRYLDEMGRRGRNGIGGLRRYLDVRGPDYVPPASGLESRALELLDEAGIEMRRQVDSGDELAWTGRVDFRHPELPFILEIQSEKYHSSLCDRVADAGRVRRLVEAGYTVLEVTDQLVWSDPAEFKRQVVAALADALVLCRQRRV